MTRAGGAMNGGPETLNTHSQQSAKTMKILSGRFTCSTVASKNGNSHFLFIKKIAELLHIRERDARI